jgi:hypothetical protein
MKFLCSHMHCSCRGFSHSAHALLTTVSLAPGCLNNLRRPEAGVMRGSTSVATASRQGVYWAAPDPRPRWTEELPVLSELVAGVPGGNASYTAALVTAEGRLVDWPLHEGRLSR